jgi:hypothetical protein
VPSWPAGPIAVRVPKANSYRLNRGRVVYYGASAELLADPARLTSVVVAQ